VNLNRSVNSRFLRIFLTAIIMAIGSFAAAQDAAKPKAADERTENGLPNVLILGDSISIGYTSHVKQLLRENANVFRPTNAKGKPENCAGTVNGVKQIDRWLAAEGGKWNVIHFNFGLHDLKRVNAKTKKNSNNPDDPHQSNPELYEKQLSQIVTKLLATKAKLIFATTTPVPAGGVKPHRDVNDPERYNEIAKKIMKKNDIEVNDLFAFAEPKMREIQIPVNVHFTKKGSEYLGKQVAEAILKNLKR
jgi:acyl-CoA thioesterase-1